MPNSTFYDINFLKLVQRIFLLGSINLLAACDIPSVSEGQWNVVTEGIGPGGINLESVWVVTDLPSLTVEGEPALVVDEIELVGSRMSWSSEMTDPSNSASPTLRVNFNGTVNGNSFAGTLFTQFGNFIVRGTRQ